MDGQTYAVRLRDLEQKVDELKEQIRRSHTRLSLLGFVFQFHFLLPEFSILENVTLPMRALGALPPAAIRDRARLAGLRASETHLALVRDHYENIRANVVYAGLDRRGRGRVMISAELPILYLKRMGSEPPRISYPEPAGSEAKPPRKPRQSKIEPEPWLESLPVHRYLPGATAGRRR